MQRFIGKPLRHKACVNSFLVSVSLCQALKLLGRERINGLGEIRFPGSKLDRRKIFLIRRVREMLAFKTQPITMFVYGSFLNDVRTIQEVAGIKLNSRFSGID